MTGGATPACHAGPPRLMLAAMVRGWDVQRLGCWGQRHSGTTPSTFTSQVSCDWCPRMGNLAAPSKSSAMPQLHALVNAPAYAAARKAAACSGLTKPLRPLGRLYLQIQGGDCWTAGLLGQPKEELCCAEKSASKPALAKPGHAQPRLAVFTSLRRYLSPPTAAPACCHCLQVPFMSTVPPSTTHRVCTSSTRSSASQAEGSSDSSSSANSMRGRARGEASPGRSASRSMSITQFRPCRQREAGQPAGCGETSRQVGQPCAGPCKSAQSCTCLRSGAPPAHVAAPYSIASIRLANVPRPPSQCVSARPAQGQPSPAARAHLHLLPPQVWEQQRADVAVPLWRPLLPGALGES